MPQESQETFRPEQIPQPSLRLLVVEDVETDVELVTLTLEAAAIAFTYDVADTATLCQRLLQERTYDAVLSDYRLPDLSGLQTLNLLQQSGQDIPLILVTGTLGEEAAVECIKAGMTDYVMKERLFRLPSVLARALQEFELRRQQQRAIARIQRQAWREAIINRIVQAMRDTLVLDEVLQTTADQLHEVLEVNRCLILQPDTDRQMQVVYVSQATVERQQLIGLYCNFVKCFYSQLASGKPLVLDRIDSHLPLELQQLATEFNTKSALVAPLLYQQSFLGGISLHQCDQEREWTTDEVALVMAIADQCAIAIHQAQLYQQTQTELAERKRMEEALRQAEAKYRGIFEHAIEGIFQITPDGRFLSANPALARIYGCESPEELMTQLSNVKQLYVNPQRQAEFLATIEKQGAVSRFEMQVYRRDGSVIWISKNAQAVRDDNGTLLYYEGSVEDITEHKQTESLLVGQKQMLEMLVTGAPLPQVLNVLCRMVEAQTEGVMCLISLETGSRGVGERESGRAGEWGSGRVGEWGSGRVGEREKSSSDSSPLHSCWSIPIVSESGRVLGTFTMYDRQPRQATPRECRVMEIATRLAGIAIERKQVEEQLRYDAFHDSLTGLYNRTWFMKQLQQLMQQVRTANEPFAVLFLDLDNFKVINDSLGHLVGDRLLVAIAKRLAACLDPTDTITRLGGDEFAILVQQLSDRNYIYCLSEQLHQSLKTPLYIEGQEIFTTASIGIVLSTTRYSAPEELLRDADIALYRAKQAGKARSVLFDSTMHQQAIARLELENSLRWAIKRQELFLHYQPIVSLTTGRITGFEALVRWQNAERGLISPCQFIPIAEETGLILPLGWWVLREACRQLRQWQTQFPSDPPLHMSVNLSGKQFVQPNLVEQLRYILVETGCNPQTLKLEITESTLMEGGESAVKMLKQLQTLGIQLCIDDFGTGYSSLSRLHQLPINTLKIDRTFVMRMGANSEAEIVRSIISLGHNLGMDIIAEGVELEEQLAQLRQLQCEYGQGYLFAKPMDRQNAEILMEATPQW